MSATAIPASAYPLVGLAAVMVVATIYLVVQLFPRRGGLPHFGTLVLVLGAFVMTTGLWLSLIYAVVDPGDNSETAVFLAINSMMAIVGAWFIAVFLRAEERKIRGTGWTWPAVVGSLVVGNELLMAGTFVLVLNGPGPYVSAGWSGVLHWFSDGATSIWFYWAMLVTMAFLAVWLPLPRNERVALLGLSTSALVGPWVIGAPLAGAVAMAAAMAVVFLLLGRELTGHPTPAFVRIGGGVAAAFGLMTTSAAMFAVDPKGLVAPLPFAVVGLVVMAAETAYLLRRGFERLGAAERTVSTP